MRSAIVLLASLFMIACGDSPTTVRTSELSVQFRSAGLVLTSHVTEPLYILAADPDFLALADLAPCLSPTCPSVPPHGTATVDRAAIVGYAATTTRVTVVYWRLSPDPAAPGTYRADGLRSVTVAVP